MADYPPGWAPRQDDPAQRWFKNLVSGPSRSLEDQKAAALARGMSPDDPLFPGNTVGGLNPLAAAAGAGQAPVMNSDIFNDVLAPTDDSDTAPDTDLTTSLSPSPLDSDTPAAPRPATPGGSGAVVPRFAMTPQAILDMAGKNSDAGVTRPDLPDISKPDVTDPTAPEFAKGYGEVNPWMSVLRAGLGTLAAPAGTTALQAIGQGGLQGVEQLDKDTSRATAEKKDIRQTSKDYRDELRTNRAENRQYEGDIANRAKTLYDMDTGDAKLNLQKQQLSLDAIKASQDGNYKDAALQLQRAELAAKAPTLETFQGIEKAKASNDPQVQAAAKSLEQYYLSRGTIGMGGVAQRDNAARLKELGDLLANPLALRQMSSEQQAALRQEYQTLLRGSSQMIAPSPTSLPGAP